MRLFENLSEVLSLNVKAPEYPAQVLPSEGSVEDGQVMQAAAEAPEAVLGRLEEPWRTALKQLHQRWPIQSVNVYQDETIDIYNFKLAIHEGRSSYVEVRLNKPGGTFGNIGAEITEGSEEKLIIGEEIVTLYMNIDYWGGYASNEQSYVRVWKNNSKEEVISIFEILIGGTSHAED